MGAVSSRRAGIERCYLVEKRPGEAGPALALQTDGVNFAGAWAAGGGELDALGVTSNDVGAVLRTFGVEAARAALVTSLSVLKQDFL